MDPDEQGAVRLENWAAMATGWEREREEREKSAAPVTEWLVREFGPKSGDTVLELAALARVTSVSIAVALARTVA